MGSRSSKSFPQRGGGFFFHQRYVMATKTYKFFTINTFWQRKQANSLGKTRLRLRSDPGEAPGGHGVVRELGSQWETSGALSNEVTCRRRTWPGRRSPDLVLLGHGGLVKAFQGLTDRTTNSLTDRPTEPTDRPSL